jgi:hypothetical protein
MGRYTVHKCIVILLFLSLSHSLTIYSPPPLKVRLLRPPLSTCLSSPKSKLAAAAIKSPVEKASLPEGPPPSNRSTSTKPRFPNPTPPATTIQAQQAKKLMANWDLGGWLRIADWDLGGWVWVADFRKLLSLGVWVWVADLPEFSGGLVRW